MAANSRPVDSSSASESHEFSLDTIDTLRLLERVTADLDALEAYEDWIKQHGHKSISTAELLADALLAANSKLRNELECLWAHYKKSDSVQSGLFGVIKSLREATNRIYALIPNDPDLPHDEPLFIRLSEKVAPVSFGEVTLDQLRLARDALKSWMPAAEKVEPSSRETANGADGSEEIMSQLRLRRLAGLHGQFLEAAKRYPYLSIVVVRPRDPIGEWPHVIVEDGRHRGLPLELWKELFRGLGYRTGKLFAPISTAWLLLGGELWEAGFYNTGDNARGDEYALKRGRPILKDGKPVTKLQAQFRRLQRGLSRFRQLGELAANHVDLPPEAPVGSYSALFARGGAWRRWLELLCFLPLWDFDPSSSVVQVARLKTDLFTASARLVELVDEHPNVDLLARKSERFVGPPLSDLSPSGDVAASQRRRSSKLVKKPASVEKRQFAARRSKRRPRRRTLPRGPSGSKQKRASPLRRRRTAATKLTGERPYLGCTIDAAEHAIVRGKKRAVFSGTVPFKLSCRLIEARESGSDRAELEQHIWNGRPHQPATLDRHKSNANSVLCNADIEIVADRKTGVWRMELMSTSNSEK